MTARDVKRVTARLLFIGAILFIALGSWYVILRAFGWFQP